MGKEYSGKLIGTNKKFSVVVSRLNEFISGKLLTGAKDALIRHGVKEGDIDIVWCPGAFEIPAVVNRIVKLKKYDAVICVGAVIRGATPHFDYVSNEVSKGIAQLALNSGLPISFGVITVDNLEQAIERAGTKAGNKGWDAALSALEMVNLFGDLK